MIKNAYPRLRGRQTTPVYVPGESYSFVINGELLSTPNFQLYDLRLVNAGGYHVKSGFASLKRVFPIPASTLFLIHCTFAFPVVPNGQYRFQIYRTDEQVGVGNPLNEDFGDDFSGLIAINGKLTSTVILVEDKDFDKTAMLEFWDDAPQYGVPYDKMSTSGSKPDFRQRFRLPITRIDLQYESERQNYRNVTDGKLRTFSQYRNANVKIEAADFDDEANEALSAVLDHNHILIDGIGIEPKTGLTIGTNQVAELNKSVFDAYMGNPDEAYGIFAGFGNLTLYAGGAGDNQILTIEP